MTHTVFITMQTITLCFDYNSVDLRNIRQMYINRRCITQVYHWAPLQHCWSNAYIKIWTEDSATSILHPL